MAFGRGWMVAVGSPGSAAGWPTWRAATQEALYGEGGFYRRTSVPRAHFRTSVHTSALFAEAVLALARQAELHTVVDVGSGGGELLGALHALDPALRLVGVEVADRPDALPESVDWLSHVPEVTDGLIVANEWLDNVPVDVAVRDGDGVRLLLVDPRTGEERPGPFVDGPDRAWLDEWWSLPAVGARAEIGHPRDTAWAATVSSLTRGLAVAIDYAHDAGRRPAGGSLAGYVDGGAVPPVPDRSCDITSHVAIDSCAAAAAALPGVGWTVVTTQRQALEALLADTSLPSYDDAPGAPAAYLARLSRASHAAELSRRDGLGDFGWLLHGVGVPQPTAVRSLAPLRLSSQRAQP